MKLNNLSLKDKKIFEKYLGAYRHELSVYAFPNIYIWKEFFRIQWQVIDEALCVYFTDKIGSFLYLEPLAKKITPTILSGAFSALSSLNKNPELSRIENAEEKNLEIYKRAGYIFQQKSSDYVCLRGDLAALKGNAFKSKRASCNYFMKHCNFSFTPYKSADKNDCFKLYDLWAEQRSHNRKEDYYQFMLEDSRKSLKTLLDNYKDLNCTGRLVKVDNQIKGFTFGFKLNKDTFCILYEITDLTIKGLAQFIFRQFSRDLSGNKYINIMDDSGLENLKRVKLSYHPVKLVPAYIVKPA